MPKVGEWKLLWGSFTFMDIWNVAVSGEGIQKMFSKAKEAFNRTLEDCARARSLAYLAQHQTFSGSK